MLSKIDSSNAQKDNTYQDIQKQAENALNYSRTFQSLTKDSVMITKRGEEGSNWRASKSFDKKSLENPQSTHVNSNTITS